MADFKTHLAVTSVLSSMGSTILLASGLAAPREVLLYFILGVSGGLLPDIDSDSSVTVRLLFTFLATVIAFLVMFASRVDNTAAELFLIWLVSFAVIRYFFFSLFTRITVHRGIIHSIPAAFFFWFLSTIILYRFFSLSSFTVWMSGLFVFFGFMTHLLLDEFAGFNLTGQSRKKSLGTALKFVNISDLKTTAFMYLAVFLLYGMVPDSSDFFMRVLDGDTYVNLDIFPDGPWFRELCRVFQMDR